MLKNATCKASLLAEASMLQHKQLITNQELQVNQIKEELRLRTELAKIQAMEKVCEEFSASKMTPRSRATHDGHDFSQVDSLQSRPPSFTESSAPQQYIPASDAPPQFPIVSDGKKCIPLKKIPQVLGPGLKHGHRGHY